MYFHPETRLFNELIAAAQRGVQITILTNGNGENAPLTHSFFGATNQKYCLKLLQLTGGNVDVFEYNEPGETLHTKVVIIDGKITIDGSHNLGYRSLEGCCDEELSVLIESEEVAKSTLAALNIYQSKAQQMALSSYSQTILSQVSAHAQNLTQYLL